MIQICKDLFAFPEAVIGKKKRMFLCLFLQSQRSPASVSARSAEGQHLRPGAEGRRHHQALAGPAGQEPAGRSSHRCQRHPAGSAVNRLPRVYTNGLGTSLRVCVLIFFFQCSSVFKVKTFDEIEVLLLSRFVSTGFGSRYIKST